VGGCEIYRLSPSSVRVHRYSGNAGKVVNGIGGITSVYVNPTLDRSGLIHYRIYDKDSDGKLDHVRDMLHGLVEVRKVAFSTVLRDSWYASKRLLLFIVGFTINT